MLESVGDKPEEYERQSAFTVSEVQRVNKHYREAELSAIDWQQLCKFLKACKT